MGPPRTGTPAYKKFLIKQKEQRHAKRQTVLDARAMANPQVKRLVNRLVKDCDGYQYRSNSHFRTVGKATCSTIKKNIVK